MDLRTMVTDYSVVVTTINSEEEARNLAHSLVEAKLAACVNIIANVTSVYNWKGQMQQDRECLMYVKTRTSLTAAVRAHFESHHPYEVPEFIVLPILEGSPSYLHWMGEWLQD